MNLPSEFVLQAGDDLFLDLLRACESRNVTFIARDGSWPIVWERAKGVHVWDADGRKYLDLTAAFGVAAAGHANPRVVRAGQEQMARLLHAMGDVHPHALKAQLARELSRITFECWTASDKWQMEGAKGCAKPASLSPATRHSSLSGKTIFCNSGFEAVEAALKTAMLASGKPGVIAFEGAYHGLGYGALNATHRECFRAPFRAQLGQFVYFVPFPQARPAPGPRSACLEEVESQIRRLFRRHQIGAILLEPIQGRGGINISPPEFLPMLRRLCDEHATLLILDEIYTGFGRTGKWFACEHSATVPDLICLGKALTGGFPLSACVGRADLMDAAWPPSSGEAIHTSTFLGHPVGCAMALAQIKEIDRQKLVPHSARLGEVLLRRLQSETPNSKSQIAVRGQGLLAGVELRRANGLPDTAAALKAIKLMLRRGYILLPEGGHSNVISFADDLRKPTPRGRERVGRDFIPMKLSEMKDILAAAEMRLSKSLGQNFLYDANQLRRIVAAAELKRSDKVLEIGPGLGPLTEMLLEQAGEVLAIEKDEKLVQFLRERFGAHLRLVHADALDYFRREERDWSEWKLVANLPYSVASPILVELAQARGGPQRMVVTLQLEVAKRLLAKPGDEDYGILTLLVQLNHEPRGAGASDASCHR